MERPKMTQTTPFAYLVKAINTKANQLNRLVKTHYNRDIKFCITYDLHSIRALGTCKTPLALAPERESHIRLNPALLNELEMAYVEEVFIHEFAHAATDQVHKVNVFNRIQPHGREFKSMCRLFGIEGKSTTKIASGSKLMKSGGAGKQSKFEYVCGCKGKIHQIGTVRHNRASAGEKYICNICKEPIWQIGTKKPANNKNRPNAKTKTHLQTFKYVCGCPNREHELTIIRHRKVLKGESYHCRDCKETLLAKGTKKPTKPTYSFS